MAEIVLFSYEKGDSKIHKLHPTLKILLLSLISISITYGSIFTVIYYILFIALGFYISGIEGDIRQSKYIVFLTIMVILFQIVFTGDFSLETILITALYVVRISLIIFMGKLFTATTKPDDITPSIYNLLPSMSIAENISLTIRLIPTFLISWSEINQTLKSRGLYLRKNPFYILRNITIPLLIETFRKSDTISSSMESRCYSKWVKCKVSENRIDILIILLAILPHLPQIKMLLQLD